ncbi:hypothetical protein BCL90_0015 [Pedobacter alluvionis]|uniref:Uncharacterized protein n=1 Tax=Pedobacter alluvionis TaxID=475253 RepID=A0A497YBD5_9SPHI|nr:hypothetical protein BCL90_0015 [Pedobacter alluvionis]
MENTAIPLKKNLIKIKKDPHYMEKIENLYNC